SADRFDPRRGNAIDWLYGVAGNVAAGMTSRKARKAKAERQLAGRAFLDADDYARVEERIDAANRLRRTYRALQHLREQDRRLLELIAVDGLSTGEAARVLSISPVAARVRLSRARVRLQTALAAGGQEGATSAPRSGWAPGDNSDPTSDLTSHPRRDEEEGRDRHDRLGRLRTSAAACADRAGRATGGQAAGRHRAPV